MILETTKVAILHYYLAIATEYGFTLKPHHVVLVTVSASDSKALVENLTNHVKDYMVRSYSSNSISAGYRSIEVCIK